MRPWDSAPGAHRWRTDSQDHMDHPRKEITGQRLMHGKLSRRTAPPRRRRDAGAQPYRPGWRHQDVAETRARSPTTTGGQPWACQGHRGSARVARATIAKPAWDNRQGGSQPTCKVLTFGIGTARGANWLTTRRKGQGPPDEQRPELRAPGTYLILITRACRLSFLHARVAAAASACGVAGGGRG